MIKENTGSYWTQRPTWAMSEEEEEVDLCDCEKGSVGEHFSVEGNHIRYL